MEPDGSGEHLWLRLEKRLLNTADVVSLLERAFAVGSADVGVSGLKDRRAVTRQWFSVRTPSDVAPLEEAIARLGAEGAAVGGGRGGGQGGGRGGGRGGGQGRDGRGGDRGDGQHGEGEGEGDGDGDDAALVLLAAARHGRKLRRGAHVANAFEIVLRDVDAPSVAAGTALDEAALEGRLERLRAGGFPNYLGPQRFGRDGQNVARARAWFRAPRRRTSRLQRGLWLSAARSELFNRVCAARVADGSWATPLDGEPLVLDGTRSFFVPDSPADAAARGVSGGGGGEAPDERLARGDIHPSGPWWGRGASPARGECARREADWLAGCADLREGLERAGLEQERRALRAFPGELVHERLDASSLRLAFTLPPGVFATTLLAELGTFTTGGSR